MGSVGVVGFVVLQGVVSVVEEDASASDAVRSPVVDAAAHVGWVTEEIGALGLDAEVSFGCARRFWWDILHCRRSWWGCGRTS